MREFEARLKALIEQAATYAQLYKINEDEERSVKMESFAEKLVEKEYIIGFAGHFSAGKSSMINALTGDDLLPSSPIPTSANIVKVRKTDSDYAIIHSTDGDVVKYGGHGFTEAVKSFSKDGGAVSLVEIGHQHSKLPEGITVMDTPGVDSTDDAHRLSTESALHLADLVFYTMDYNHVQSEVNFRFTKELMRYNENVYLIVNQIDKHRDSELSFQEFKKTVEESFAVWGVVPKGVFYTSLKDSAHPHNDFQTVKTIIDNAMSSWKDQFLMNADKMIVKLKEEHSQYLTEEIEDRKHTYSDILLPEEWDGIEELEEKMSGLKRMHTLQTGDTFSIAFEKERKALLEGAAITPYETRELLKSYLESLSPAFKVGLLFSAKKTMEERTKRKKALASNMGDLVHAQIEVHVKTLMKKLLREAGVMTDERSLAIDGIDMTIPFADIEREFNVGDVITGDTVLNYAERMKTATQSVFRRLTEEWKNGMAGVIHSTGNNHVVQLEQKISQLEHKVGAIRQVNALTAKLMAVETEIENHAADFEVGRQNFIHKWQSKENLQITQFDETESIINETLEPKEQQEENHQLDGPAEMVNPQFVIEQAKHVANAMVSIPGFIETADYLRRKASRLEGQEFTVALFGAFSAGKSSFSNALIGEQVLPVSPNPTTAAINKIRPVSDDKEDGTADVMLKTVERMTEDVVRSFDILGVTVASLEEAFSKVDVALNLERVDENVHSHKAFITAFKKGYPVYKDVLGTIVKAERTEFVKFVAQEERSCFVESIDFFYDCELTRKGITLVDTPGADSVNARHTDVAFEYIRNADAILFVTYYNHAFARADREFLIQLGRVKDAFELDKMFFIVNAIDLASNDEEAEQVKAFVSDELQKFGIRNPRVHGISSLQALQAKFENRNDTHMTPFEKDFHHFLENDLKGLAVQVLLEETEKVIDRLASLISRTETNLLRKKERFDELNRLEGEVRQYFTNSFATVLNKAANNELSELVYYILQRVFLRFGDFFKEAYNPSVFVNNSADRALSGALEETIQMLGFDLTQELKVTNLRMSNFMKRQLNDRQRVEVSSLRELDESLTPSPYETNDADMLNFRFPYPTVNPYSSVNKLFKNQKAFFERGEREVLRSRLEEQLKNDAAIYLGKERELLEKWSERWIEDESEGLRQHLLKESLDQIESERNLLQGTEKLAEWRDVYETLRLEEPM
ncbi:dynamin family protein [Filibacter tadaridae]|uniref:Clamp-binding protein CrfC n=1 Tax=Filibacter tadaridae TaxID=2483811 RepID=A0A3P5XG21_9BACL|nr:dynamin family protein [Filibacter tadaridae]VDC29098.1 Clamp-binding protein CrfC [Filibacter tadaridae]